MNDPISEADNVMDLWSQAIDEFERLEKVAGKAEVEYRAARANAYERATGTGVARGYYVDRATSKESLARYEAAAAAKAADKKLRWWEKKAGLRHTDIVNERAFAGGMGT